MKTKNKMLKKLTAVLCAATMVVSGAAASVGAVDPEKEGQKCINKVQAVINSDEYKQGGREKRKRLLTAAYHDKKLKRQFGVKENRAKSKAREQLEEAKNQVENQNKILKYKRTELINKVIKENKAQTKKGKETKKQEVEEIRKQLEEAKKKAIEAKKQLKEAKDKVENQMQVETQQQISKNKRIEVINKIIEKEQAKKKELEAKKKELEAEKKAEELRAKKLQETAVRERMMTQQRQNIQKLKDRMSKTNEVFKGKNKSNIIEPAKYKQKLEETEKQAQEPKNLSEEDRVRKRMIMQQKQKIQKLKDRMQETENLFYETADNYFATVNKVDNISDKPEDIQNNIKSTNRVYNWSFDKNGKLNIKNAKEFIACANKTIDMISDFMKKDDLNKNNQK